MSEKKSDIFNTLFNVNVENHVEEKNGLKYLAWAFAWAEIKKLYPRSFYTIYENADGRNYFDDGRTCWVKTGVTVVDGDYSIEHIEYLPIMDYKNASIPKEKVTSFDVNKSIQRSLTKACARHGLGLYIYAGEDLPEEDKKAEEEKKKAEKEVEDEIKAARADVVKLCKEKIAKGVPQETVYQAIRDLNGGNANPNSIKDIATLKSVLDAVKKLEVQQ